MKRTVVPTCAAVLSGGCIALAGAPYDLYLLAFLAPALLLAALRGHQRSLRAAFLLGLITGMTANAIALSWVVGLLQEFAGFPWPAAFATAALLWAAQGLPFALACVGAKALERETSRLWLLLPAFLVVCLSSTPMLFPWRLASTQVAFTPWIQMAELGGEPLLDACIALTGCALGEAVFSRKRRLLAVAALACLAPFLYGSLRIDQVERERTLSPIVHVGVVQPNVGIWEKRNRSLSFEQLDDLRSATLGLQVQGAAIVVWPETAYPFRIPRSQTRDREGPWSVRGDDLRTGLLIGAITLGTPGQRYNSVVAMEGDGSISGIADKVRLLAFGEYVPLWDYLPPLKERFSRGLSAGHSPVVLEVAGQRVGILNCYEDVLGRYARRVALLDPGFLVNATNDAWFGDTNEPWLHQAVARLRSVETRRDLVRAVNTGVSSHTSATGTDLVRTNTWIPASFVAEVRVLSGTTPWVVLGDLLTPGISGGLLGLLFGTWRRRRAA